MQRRLEEGVLEAVAVLLQQLEHAALALLAADRLGVLRPLDLALVVGGGRRVDEPRLAAGADVGGDVGAGPVEQREVLRRMDGDARQRRRAAAATSSHVSSR